MILKNENKRMLLFMISLISFYFIWIKAWQNHETIQTIGGTILSISGALAASVWLWIAVKRNTLKEIQIYLMLLILCTAFYALAEMSLFLVTTLFLDDNLFTGLYYFSRTCSDFSYFSACVYIIWKRGNSSMLIKFFFDVGILMSVSLSFTWYYLIIPLLEYQFSPLRFVTMLHYPVANLFLLLCGYTFYFGGNLFFKKSTLYKILLAMLLHIATDFMYFFDMIHETYITADWLDPLLILPIMMIGYIALCDIKFEPEKLVKIDELSKTPTSQLRFLLPYVSIAVLFVFMTTKAPGINVISISCGLTILFILFRQVVVVSENERLVKQFQLKKEELDISRERYKSLFEQHPDSIFALDLKGQIESINSAGTALMGYETRTIMGSPVTDFITPHHKELLAGNISCLKDGLVQNQEFKLKNQAEKELWIHLTEIPILVKDQFSGIFGIGKDITESKANKEKLQYYANHDYLTGLVNRRVFEEELARVIDDSTQFGTSFGLIFLDLNDFKKINDNHGHKTGDALLVAVAERINTFSGDSDFPARIGGDEFTILIQGSSRKIVQEKLETFSNWLNQPYLIKERRISCAASLGAAYYPEDGKTPEELLRRADQAMYRAKKTGRR